MRSILAIFLLALLPAAPVAAGAATTGSVTQHGVELAATRLGSSLVARADLSASASYGPFRVIDAATAALVDVIGHHSPGASLAMLRQHPHILPLPFLASPGNHVDHAHLAPVRMYRYTGL